MNYENMKKVDLIEKLEEQTHLAKAVEAKDKEISELKNKYVNYVSREHVIKLEEDVNKLKDIAAKYVTAYRDYIKLMKQSLDMTIFTEELLSEKLK